MRVEPSEEDKIKAWNDVTVVLSFSVDFLSLRLIE